MQITYQKTVTMDVKELTPAIMRKLADDGAVITHVENGTAPKRGGRPKGAKDKRPRKRKALPKPSPRVRAYEKLAM